MHGADRSLRLMGVLNVTPDSFSDGGRFRTVEDAVGYGAQLAERGADLVDVGGESTRPGALRIDEEIELGRVIPVIRGLAERGVACSVDTTRARVATAAIAAGAVAVNDVSGGMADPAMARTMADNGLPWVLMHWRAPSVTMADHAVYGDVVADVVDELSARVDAALAAGVAHAAIVLDPGLGFAKTGAHNWVLLRELPRLVALGFPVLVGASRKRFLPPSGEKPGSAADLGWRDLSTAVVTFAVATAGGWGVRVHDIAGSDNAARVAQLIGEGSR